LPKTSLRSFARLALKAFLGLALMLTFAASRVALAQGGLMVSDLTTQTPTALVQRIIGNNVPFSNVIYTGAQAASGSFSGGTGIIGFEDGILLTSGSVRNVIGPNVEDGKSTENGTPGDADLNVITAGTQDAAVLEFDFVPTDDTLFFQYVFASEEYNEFANSAFNDVFAFFLNGTNVALIPSTTTPVSINTVNGGDPFGTNAQNPQFFRNNDLQDGGGTINTEMDGLTVVFNVQATVTPNQTNHIKLAIADVSDGILDSAVFIRSGSFVVTPKPGRLGNISTRGRVETGDNVLIGGFIVTGAQPKKVIARAVGPSLPVAGKLANPILELHKPDGSVVTNDNWVDAANKQEIIDSTIPPTNDLESAILTTLAANSSAYTAIVRGVNNTTGVGLVEAYDLDLSLDSKLANISTRGLVQAGDNVMIGGFIVVNDPLKVIVRAIGPSLPVSGKLANPTLELHDGNGAVLESNDDWVNSPNKQAIIDSTIPPTNDLESSIVRTLPPGNYTAIVSGVNNTTGIALVEVYALN